MLPGPATPRPAARGIGPPAPRGGPGPLPAGVEPPRPARRRPPLRLPTLLAGLLAAVLLPMLLLGGAAIWQAVEGRQAAARGQLRDTARALSLAVDREIGAYRSAVATLAASSSLDGREPDLRRFEVEARRAAAALGTSVILLDAATMRQAVNTALPPGAPAGAVSAGDFRAVAETGRSLVTDLVAGTVARRPVVGVAVPVERDGRVPFVLAARLAPEHLHRLLAAQRPSGAGFAGVTDAKNVVVARSDARHEELVGRAIPPENARRIDGRGAGLYRAAALDGAEHVFGFHKLDAAPGWTVFVAAPAAAFDAAWRWPLLAFAAGGVLALASGGALALLAARGVLGPVRRLTEHARALAEGGDTAVPPSGSAAAIPPARVAELEALRRGFAGAEAAIASREAALAEAEAARRDLLATLDLGAAVARDLGGTIRHWSKGCERLYGWTAEEAVGRSSHDLLRTAFPVPLAEIEAALEREGEWTGELRHRARDGREVVVLARKVLRRDAAGRPAAVLESLADVTAQRRAEAELAESEARLRTATDNARVGLVVVEAGHRYRFANRAYAEIFGLPSADIVGRRVADVLPDVYAGQIAPRLERAFAGERVSYELARPARAGRGEEHFAVAYEPGRTPSGEPVVVVVVSDVTERTRAARGVAASEARLRTVLDNLFAFVGVLAPDGTVLEANRAPLDAAGIAIGDVRGKPFWECAWWSHDTAEAARVREAVARAAAGEPSRYDAVVRMAGDRRMTIDFQVAPLRDAEGRITHLIPSATDITARIAAQASLRDQEAFLRSVLDASNDCLKVVERDGTLSFMNANGRCLMEIGDACVVEGAEWAALWPEANRGQIRGAVAAALSGRPSRFEAFCPTALGTPKWWDVAVAPVRDAGGRVARLVATSRDITLRKAVEAGLRESEATLNAVLDALPVGVMVADAEGRIVRDNAANRELWGIPPETTSREGHADRVGWWPETGERIRAQDWGMARALLKGEVVRDELVECARFGTGERRFYLNNAAPVRDAEGRIVAGVVAELDVTERRATEAALAESEARLRLEAERVQLALAAGAIVGTWDWDLPADRFTVDERFAESFGLDPALGRSGLSLEQVIAAVHPDDLAGLRQAIAEAVARGGRYSHEYRVRGRDGAYRWIEANGRVDHGPGGTPLRFPGVLLDVERRRATEAERDRAAALLRAFVEAVPGVVYAKDREGRMLIANEGTAALIGKRPEEFIGKTDAEFLGDAAQAEAVMANDRRIMEGGAAEQVEEAVSLPDGTPAVWLSTKAPFKDATGEVIGLVGSSLDITGRKRAEERLRLMLNELNHRVKNTLATVLSIASQTMRGTDPALREAFEDRLLALAAAHDVLTREGWAGADIDEVVAGVLAPHGGPGDGRFRVSGPRVRLAPRAAVALSMGLHELATNALKYGALSREGGAGRVEIRWEVVPGGDAAGPRFRLAWTERGGPPVSPPARRGFGTRLVEGSLARDLDGTASLDFAPGGLACVIEAPLAGVAAPAEAPPLPRVGGTGEFGS